MTSILTNTSAMSALSALTATQRSLATTQNQVSTGLRVSSASDDASDWSIATLMRSDISALGSVQDSIHLTNSIAQITSAAIDRIMADVQGIAEDLMTAGTAGVDKDVLQQDVARRQANIIQVATSASFNGVNWLVGSRTANVDITEHHVLDETYGTIDSEMASHAQGMDPMPTYAPTDNHNDPKNTVYSTQPQPTPYYYHDALTYTATADETDAAGNHQTQTLSYQGDDLDETSTPFVAWGSNYASPPATLAWQPLADLDRHRDSIAPVSASNFTNSGSVDFRDAEQDHVPIGIAGGTTQSMGIDTNQFLMFTDYTGTTTVTEDTTDAAGRVKSGNFTQSLYSTSDHSYTKPSSYTSYDTDNGFDVDPGALDAAVGSSNGANDLYTDPEDDFGVASKTSVLNFDLRDADPAEMLNAVQADLVSLRSMASTIGRLQTSLADQSTYVSSLADLLTAGVGSLVDADMNQASTRETALQTQQQLGIQALSIANDNAKLFLKLFGG